MEPKADYVRKLSYAEIKAKNQGYEFTKKQLSKWKVKYHKLIFGKPSYDYYIDDKSIFYNKNWTKKINKKFL